MVHREMAHRHVWAFIEMGAVYNFDDNNNNNSHELLC